MSDENRPPGDPGPAPAEPAEPADQKRRVVVRRSAPPTPSSGSPYSHLTDLGRDPLDWPLIDPEDLPGSRPSGMRPFIVGMLLGVGLAAVSIISFLALRSSPEAPTTTEPTPTSQPAEAPTTLTTLQLPTTTLPGPPPTIPTIEAVGEPIGIDELRLASTAIGPLTIGSNGTETLGRLVATLGQPAADTGSVISTGEYGSCNGDPLRVVRWGPLAVVVENPDGESSFASYRLDLSYGDLDSPAAGLRTVSGIATGDSIETLESTYSSYTISYVVDPDLGQVFELSNADGALLLWGPVTSSDPDGKIVGIYSPDPCTP